MSRADGFQGDASGDPEPSSPSSQRLDKWLWFARVIKSRTQAAGLVTGGRVRVNRDKADKPSQLVRAGDVLTIGAGGRIRILKVMAIGDRRGPATEARTLYEDLTPPTPISAKEPDMPRRDPGAGRPTKRDRRQVDRLRKDEG